METAKRLAEEDRAGQSIDQLKESERELTGLFGSLLDTMRPDGDSVEKADAERIRKVGAQRSRRQCRYQLQGLWSMAALYV